MQEASGARARPNLWQVLSVAAAALVAVPIVAVPSLALFPTDNIWPHLWETVLGGYVMRTAGLMLGVGLGTLLLGISTAWLVTVCRFPGSPVLAWALLLPFAVPSYVVAYVYTDVLEYAGPVQTALRAAFGFTSAADYWFPEIRSLGGAIVSMSMVLYPYVYLLARAAFLEQSGSFVDASRTLGCAPWRSFLRVSLPMARPAIAVGLAFVLMETLNDFGTVDYFAVRTLTAGIYDVWLNMGNLGGAAQIASVMLLVVFGLIYLERASRRGRRHHHDSDRDAARNPYRLGAWKAAAALAVCLFPVLAGFVLPACVLGYYALTQAGGDGLPFWRFAANSLGLASGAAGIAVVLGLLIGYAQRAHPGRFLAAAASISRLGYAVPGAVLAVGVIVPLGAFDNAVDRAAREYLGFSTGLLLTGSVGALLFAYVARFLAAALGAIESSLATITPSMDQAARSLGYTATGAFTRVHLPLVRGGVITAAIIVFVDTMKELPATLILRPFNFDTLATHVYQFASDELIEQAAPGALLIVAVGLLPVIFLSRSMGRGGAAERAARRTAVPAGQPVG